MEIKGRFDHFNFNVLDLQRSINFYEKALGLKEVRRKETADGSFILVYMGDGQTGFTLELTWLRDRKEPYNLGEGEYIISACECLGIMTRYGVSTRRWGACATRIPTWGCILLRIRMDTGLRFCPCTNKRMYVNNWNGKYNL